MHRVLRVILTASSFCQIAARRWSSRGRRIITTASINGFRGVENLVGYNAAKAGVSEMTTMRGRARAASHAVNAIAPAPDRYRLTRTLPRNARAAR